MSGIVATKENVAVANKVCRWITRIISCSTMVECVTMISKTIERGYAFNCLSTTMHIIFRVSGQTELDQKLTKLHYICVQLRL